MDHNELWNNVLGEIELHISRPNFLTWLKQSNMVGRNEKDGVALVGLPNNFAKEWVKSRYHKMILGSLRSHDSSIRGVDYVVVNPDTEEALKRRVRAHKKVEVGPAAAQEPLIELRVDTKTNLNPKYTFSSFVVGTSNELAFAAMQAVIDHVGTKYNPLFIYGGVGLGKTHLIQAAGNEIVARYNAKVRVLYVTSERFINDVVWAVRNRRMEDVKSKYRDIDVLIIDDIQFIGGKAATEQEFFYTFNTLYEHNKQIIMSSDRPPAAIPTLEERLRSRFEGGMIVDVVYPDYEMRLAILRTRMQEHNLSIDEEVLQYMAEKIQKSVRELEGVFNKVVFYQQVKHETITKRRVDEIVGKTAEAAAHHTTIQDVVRCVAEAFDMPPQDLTHRSRKKEVVVPRQVCMYLMRDILSLSYPHIGEKMGKRDHTTVIHACEKINRELQNNVTLQQKIMLIREKVQKG